MTLKLLTYDFLKHTTLRRPLVAWRHLGLRETDVMVASYPRSGNTWLRFLLHTALTGQEPGFDIVAKTIPDIGKHRSAPTLASRNGRYIKTHELYNPAYQRAIYLVRDPRDIVLSEYRYAIRNGLYQGELEQFVNLFVKGNANTVGSWADHVTGWINASRNGQVELQLLHFERMRNQPLETLRSLFDFLGHEIKEPVLQHAIEMSRLDRMKAKENEQPETLASNIGKDPSLRFVNQGAVEGWRKSLPPQLAQLITDRFASALETVGYPTANAND